VQSIPLPSTGKLLRLILNDNPLGGMLTLDPAYIGLQTLSLSGTNLTGTIPPNFLLPMTNISLLELSNNALEGTVPASVLYSSTLLKLVISGNAFTGMAPPPPAVIKSEIKELYAADNSLTAIPSLDTFVELVTLDLSRNSFSGTLTLPLTGATAIFTLRLAGNSYTAVEPGFKNKVTTLQVLDISSNNLDDLGTVLDRMPGELTELDLSNNGAALGPGFAFSRISGAFVRVKSVDLSDNNIGGPLLITATDVFELGSLVTLDLSNNSLVGDVPQLVGELPSLKLLDLRNNPGMEAKRGPGPFLPDFVSPDFRAADVVTLPGGACPQLLGTSGMELKVDPSYYSYLLCRCRDGFYNTSRGDLASCAECLPNSKCVGYPSTTAPYAVPDAGYFPST